MKRSKFPFCASFLVITFYSASFVTEITTNNDVALAFSPAFPYFSDRTRYFYLNSLGNKNVGSTAPADVASNGITNSADLDVLLLSNSNRKVDGVEAADSFTQGKASPITFGNELVTRGGEAQRQPSDYGANFNIQRFLEPPLGGQIVVISVNDSRTRRNEHLAPDTGFPLRTGSSKPDGFFGASDFWENERKRQEDALWRQKINARDLQRDAAQPLEQKRLQQNFSGATSFSEAGLITVEKRFLGDRCNDDELGTLQCQFGVLFSHCVKLGNTNSKCACEDNWTAFEDFGCLPKRALGERCTISAQCSYIGGICNFTSTACTCDLQSFLLTSSTIGPSCLPILGNINDTCWVDEQCSRGITHSRCVNNTAENRTKYAAQSTNNATTNVSLSQCQCENGYESVGAGFCVMACPAGTLKCVSGECVNEAAARCDGRNDCADGSDERGCKLTSANQSCPTGTWQCNNGACLRQASVCDGINDCADIVDSNNQPNNITVIMESIISDNNDTASNDTTSGNNTDPATTVNSTSTVTTIISNAKSSDEMHCIAVANGNAETVDSDQELSAASANESLKCPLPYLFRCLGTAKCISQALVCNGIDDCSDGADEVGCNNYSRENSTAVAKTMANEAAMPSNVTSCPVTAFHCDNKRCVPAVFHCYGGDNCGDGSDERNCFWLNALDLIHMVKERTKGGR